MACPKESLVIGSVGAIARGLINQDFLESIRDTCIVCGMCAKVCPVNALEMRLDGNPVKDETYLCGALKPTTVSDDCVYCGLCEQVCPQECITVSWRLANDSSTSIEGETIIDKESCIHCGWCEAVCPVDAITVEKPFAGEWQTDEEVCQTCRTCIDVCPCNAILARKWDPGERVEKITQRPNACIYCGACAISCPVDAITVTKIAIVPDMSKKKPFEKKITGVPTPRPTQTSRLVTDEDACLMSQKAREDTFNECHAWARDRSDLGGVDRELSLYDIAVLTRANPARTVGISHRKGSLGVGADGDVTIYNIDPTKLSTRNYEQVIRNFEQAEYTIKDGGVVSAQGEIKMIPEKRTYYTDITIKDEGEKEMLSDVKEWFKYYTLGFANYPTPEKYLMNPTSIKVNNEG